MVMDVSCLDEWVSMLLGSLRLSVRASRLCSQTLLRMGEGMPTNMAASQAGFRARRSGKLCT